MQWRMIFFTTLLASMTIVAGCGSNEAPNGSTIQLDKSAISIKDTVDPYIDEYVMVTVMGPSVGSTSGTSGTPMNGVKVSYESTFAVGQEGNNNTGLLAFIDKNGNICPSPCSDTTDSRGTVRMHIRLCLMTAPGCPFSSISSITGTTSISYGPVYVYVSSGNAAPASIEFNVNNTQ